MHLVLSGALFALIACALAQTCEPFSAAAAPQCAGLIDYPVWVPPGLSQQLLGISLTQYAPGASLLPGDCARAAIAVLCSGAFRECNPSSPQAPLPLCIDFCTRGRETCAGIPAGQAIFNCSASDPFLGDSVKLWSGSPSCSVANASTPTLYCPLPFTFHPAVQGCSMKCPPIGLDDASSNDKIWILSKVFGSTSLVLEVLILLPVWHQTKKGTLNCMLHFWIANLLGTIGTLTPRWNSWESAICSDDWTLRSSSSTTCFVTAFCNIAALTAVAYWLMFAMYSLLIRQPGFRWLALSTYLDGERLPWLTERSVLLGIGWGLPCTQFLIPLIAGWLDATTGAYSCSINPTVHDGWALNGLIYVPLTVTMTISTTIILTVMFLVVKNGFGAVRTQWRILAVGSYYICIVWIVVGYAWHSYAVRHAVTKAVETAIGASIASNGAVSYQAVYREKSPLSADFNVAVIALVTSLGTVLGLLFLVTPGHWRYYQHIFSTGRLTWSESEPGPSSGVATSRRGNSSSM